MQIDTDLLRIIISTADDLSGSTKVDDLEPQMNLVNFLRDFRQSHTFHKKSELMLKRRATASVSFRTQVVLVYIQYISAKIHSKCASQPIIAKKSLKTHILGVQGRSFKIIDVGTPGKIVSSACYDTQRVCVYLQPFSC